MRNSTKKTLIISGLVLLVAATRLLPHPFNFTPVVALCLFSVAVMDNKVLKFILPAVAIIYSDVLIEMVSGFGFHSGTALVYGAFAIIMLGAFFALKKINFKNVILTSLAASTIFFLVTNFALFYPAALVNNPSLGHYTHDFSGILASYTAGLPFFRNMLIGDLFYTGMLFGVYSLATKALAIRPAIR